MAIGLVQLEAEHGRGGELQVDDRAGAGRAEFGGDAPRLRQAAGARVVEHVDRAELVQRPQPPHGQPGRVGRGEGLFEGVPGAVEIAGPADPAEQLQRPAADLGARPRRGQDALGEGTRPVARVVGGQGDLGVQHGRLGAEAGLGIGGEQVARDADVPPRGRPPGPVHRRVGQLEVDRRPPDGGVATRREPGDEPVADQHRLVHLPGQGQGLDEERFGLGALIRRGEQARGPAQGAGRGGQRAPAERRPPGFGQQQAGPARIVGLDGQVRGQVAGCAGQPGMSRLQRGERPGGEGDPPRRQQLGGHRLPGEHVPEPENAAVHGQQLRPPPRVRARRRPRRRPARWRAAAAASRTAARTARRCAGPAVPPRSGPPAGPGPLRRTSSARPARPATPRPGTEPRRPGRCTRAMTSSDGGRQARAYHRGDLAGRQPSERDADRGPPSVQPGHQSGRRRGRLVPAGGQAQDRLRGQVVAQVLQDRERVRVRPVQVLEHQQQPGGSGQPSQQLQHGLAAHRRGVVAVPVALRPARSPGGSPATPAATAPGRRRRGTRARAAPAAGPRSAAGRDWRYWPGPPGRSAPARRGPAHRRPAPRPAGTCRSRPRRPGTPPRPRRPRPRRARTAARRTPPRGRSPPGTAGPPPDQYAPPARSPAPSRRLPPARIRVNTHAPLPSSPGRGRPGPGVTYSELVFAPMSAIPARADDGPRPAGTRPGTEERE